MNNVSFFDEKGERKRIDRGYNTSGWNNYSHPVATLLTYANP